MLRSSRGDLANFSKRARLVRVCGTVTSEEAWQPGGERGQLTCAEERAWLTTSQARTSGNSGLETEIHGWREENGEQERTFRPPGEGMQQEQTVALTPVWVKVLGDFG